MNLRVCDPWTCCDCCESRGCLAICAVTRLQHMHTTHTSEGLHLQEHAANVWVNNDWVRNLVLADGASWCPSGQTLASVWQSLRGQ